MRIYQAGPLFSEAEREWHKALKARLLTAGHEVIWPGDLITQEEIAEWGDEAPARILQRDLEGIISCKAVVALLDGPQVDDGTAFEIGYAYAKGIPVFGVRTDFRVCGDTPKGSLNAMIEGSLRGLARSRTELFAILMTSGDLS
ncbi:MAG: nucleoside 2-deoxyribosyltransferase [Desulfovibrio sp.]|nr:nucleoside 2-deoxyribosyltransferase [Desulfovibrio sp.]